MHNYKELANQKLIQLKSEVYNNFNSEKIFKKTILEQPELRKNKLYDLCTRMPKGGDLHAHGGTILPAKNLINLLKNKNNIYICYKGKDAGFLTWKSEKIDENYMQFNQAIQQNILSYNEIEELWTLKNKQNKGNIWDIFSGLLEKHDAINELGPFLEDFFYESCMYYCSRNIMHVELRFFLIGSSYDANKKIECLLKAYLKAKETYPEFTIKIITVGLKSNDVDLSFSQTTLNNTLNNYNKYTYDYQNNKIRLIAGFDLVNEEDTSRSIAEYKSILNEAKFKNPDIDYFLHAGESKNKSNNEIAEALKHNPKRIGHAYNLYMHPEVKKQIIKNNVCIEVCPESNLILQYCEDLRFHPAKDYIKEGIPLVLASDDALYQESETLIDDFFHSILAWDLNIQQIKTLCINSIKYSSLSKKVKSIKLKEWNKNWNSFILDF